MQLKKLGLLISRANATKIGYVPAGENIFSLKTQNITFTEPSNTYDAKLFTLQTQDITAVSELQYNGKMFTFQTQDITAVSNAAYNGKIFTFKTQHITAEIVAS